MSCCGKKREQFSAGPAHRPHNGHPVTYPPISQLPLQSRVFFEYVGRIGLTVIGPATGKSYRFERSGARVEIDLRDRPGLSVVPNLRQLAATDFRTAR